jgi:UDP-GlcNAc:undecaprenyl-phosphate/decaprenyl-phosphate GlcNAc-1-phosphate transferase
MGSPRGLRNDYMPKLALYALISCAVSLALVPLARILAWRTGCVARPTLDRWHRKPTPMFGGVAIAVATIGVALAAGLGPELKLPLACGAIIFVVGLVDDVLHLKPSTKLIAQIAVASGLLYFGYRLAWVESLTLDTMLTLVWLVGITNALNLLDNMDGLCAGISIIVAASILAGLLPVEANGARAIYLAILIGATAGFLVFNFHPASIFMGDSGSLFLGLSVALVTLGLPDESRGRSGLLSAVAAPLLVMLIPILDTTLVTASRLLWGRRASQGGRDHTSHRLVAIGLPERTAVAVLWMLAGFGGAIAFSTRRGGLLSLESALLFVLALIVFAVYLGHVKVYEETEPALLKGNRVTPMLFRMMYKRRVAEVLLDLCLVTIAYYSAYRLRFEGAQFVTFFPVFIDSLPIALGIQLVTYFVIGVYRPVWRHFSLMDAVVFAKSTLVGVVLTVVAAVYLYRFEHFSRGVFVIYGALLMLLTTGSRASFRLISEFARRRRQGTRLIVYGAGDAGALLVRELLTNTKTNYAVLGFVDDDPAKQRMRLQGYEVLGSFSALTGLIKGGAVDAVIVAARDMKPARIQDLEALCREHNVRLSRLHFDLVEITAAS